ncbi:hypothetical protein BD779DRAFT_1514257 [Infundibulicybe gibba]|nr:hypothetical protein BD779DRAFT_1514257 [Infundibulicybe gibba]
MMAQLLSPNPPAAGRISQLLPTVKCSNCNQPVPLAELGDHTCSAPPATPTLPKPAVAPSAISSLLPERFQNRVVAPPSNDTAPSPRVVPPPENRPQSQTIQQRLRAASNARPRVNTTSSGSASSPSYQSRPSPLSRLAEPDRTRSSSPSPSPVLSRPPVKEPYTPITTSPLRTQPPPSPQSQPQPPPNLHNNDLRSRAASNAGSIALSPNNTAPLNPRPTYTVVNRDPPPSNVQQQPPRMQGPPPPREMTYSPHVPENIDTKSGGEAGMAGVGRRGFAAAARAAMFAVPPRGPELHLHGQSPPQPGLRANAPKYLDIDAASRSTTTPPLSAGSGYSSHSPGPLSPFPPSPRSPHSPRSPSHGKVPSHPSRTPSPNVHGIPIPPASPAPTTPLPPPPTMGAVDIPPKTPSTPLSSVRLPFFEKFKNKLPGVNTTPTAADTEAESDNSGIPSATSTAPLRVSSRASSSKLYKSSSSASSSTSGSFPTRSASNSTASTSTSPRGGAPKPTPQTPMSPSSGSEYGLAYADSTDYEDDDRGGARTTTPPPLPGSILRSPQMGKPDDRTHERFPSLASDRSGIRIGKAPDHKRGPSASSYASEGVDARDGMRSRSASASGSEGSNSAAVAQALGLSKRPGGHRRAAGPGAARSVSGSSSSSGGSRSAYSRGSAGGSVINGGAVGLERMDTLETLPEDDSLVLSAVDAGDKDPNNKSHRSNTVQVPYSPDARAVKLPTRSKTSPATDRDKKLETASAGVAVEGKRVRMRRPKECVRCEKCIDDGRWVQVDGGGILCEKCWKGMYLPKCRRCNLPIEKQAVSSSDGQLKGKYHRECFNCHTCHKPFPDKTFYVFDGKPLCAYHYHEANDSLCAAAHCGQPIEGPCAVSHTGDRYHPAHLTCEYAGYPECHERLEEYWEVDGRMLCERHSRADEEDLGSGREESTRAMKRKTRFIDLAGAGMGAPSAPASVDGNGQELGGSELR